MQKWRKALAVLTIVAILGISLGYPVAQLLQHWSQDHAVVVVQEREEGDHKHGDDHGHEDENDNGHEHEGDDRGHEGDKHEDEGDGHEHHHDGDEGPKPTPVPEPDHGDNGHEHEDEAEHTKPAFEVYGLVRSEPGYREFNVKLSQFSFEPNTIRVHRGDRVRLNLDAVDVEHGIAIDGYDDTVSVPVEKVVSIEFVATEGGAMRFRCSVTCGAFHPFMVGRIVVEPETTFPWAMFLVGVAPLVLLGGYVLWKKA